MKNQRHFLRAALAVAAILVSSTVARAEWTVGDVLRARRATAEHALRHGVPRSAERSYREVVREMTLLLEILPEEVLALELARKPEPKTRPLVPGPVKPADGASIPWYGPDFVGPLPR